MNIIGGDIISDQIMTTGEARELEFVIDYRELEREKEFVFLTSTAKTKSVKAVQIRIAKTSAALSGIECYMESGY